MLVRLFACIWLLASLAAAQSTATAAVPLDKEPVHHLVFENEYVRVFQVEVAVRAATLLHRHDKDYIFVTLGESEVSNERQGENPAVLKLKDGDTRFVRGGFAHVARNLSDTPFRNVTVEILPLASSFSCGVGKSTSPNTATVNACPAPVTANGPAVSWSGVVESDKFAVKQHSIQPSGTVSQHRHKGPHLVIAISNLSLRNEVEGKPPVEINQSVGDIKWLPGGFAHSVTNVGTEPARFVTLEFK
jgi:quercetin dioxygenase-like cupin family protein